MVQEEKCWLLIIFDQTKCQRLLDMYIIEPNELLRIGTRYIFLSCFVDRYFSEGPITKTNNLSFVAYTLLYMWSINIYVWILSNG